MTQPESIHQAIQALRAELVAVEDRAAKIRQALRSLEDLQPAAPAHSGKKAAPSPLTHRLRGQTMVKAAALVLKDAQSPLHVSDIMDRMLEGGYQPGTPDNFRLSLVGSLDRGTKGDGWFYKAAPATYGLREFEHASHGTNGSSGGQGKSSVKA